ncbi:MAG: hypothetical protein ACLRH1_11715 [Acutalibacteraceae bacterium]
MRHPDDRHDCLLFGRPILWGGCGGCVEVQEVREDSMDMELFPEPFDLSAADAACEKCRWYRVNEQAQ